MLIAYAGRPTVTLNGNKVSGWTFDQNNVLSFELQAGYSAWLQFTVLPGGALFMGTMAPSNAEGYISDKEFQVRTIFFMTLPLLNAGCLCCLLCSIKFTQCIRTYICRRVHR